MAEEKFNSKKQIYELVEILTLYQKVEVKPTEIDKKGYECGYYDGVKIRKQVDKK